MKKNLRLSLPTLLSADELCQKICRRHLNTFSDFTSFDCGKCVWDCAKKNKSTWLARFGWKAALLQLCTANTGLYFFIFRASRALKRWNLTKILHISERVPNTNYSSAASIYC